MADSVEMQDIRGLNVDKAIKGFALTNYVFKNDVTISGMTGDSVRWYKETAADLTATAPSVVKNISPLSSFPTLEPTWTRTTSYPQKYAAEGFISIEDIKSADIDVLARTLLRLTRAVIKQVDTHIWDIMTESQSPTNIHSVTSNAAWDAGSGQDPVEDVLEAIQDIQEYDYDISGGVLYLNPKNHKSLLTWLITSKGDMVPSWAANKLENGSISSFLGLRVRVSNNVTADKACVAIPKQAVTYKVHTNTTAKVIDEPGIGKKVRIWEMGIAILTDPKCVALIANTDS